MGLELRSTRGYSVILVMSQMYVGLIQRGSSSGLGWTQMATFVRRGCVEHSSSNRINWVGRGSSSWT